MDIESSLGEAADHLCDSLADEDEAARLCEINLCVEHFKQLLRGIPRRLFPCHLEPSSHGAVLDSHVRGAAIAAFGPPPRRTRQKQEYLTAETLVHVTNRRWWLRQWHKAGKLMRGSCVRWLFQFWASKHVLPKRNRHCRRYHAVFGFHTQWLVRQRYRGHVWQSRLHGSICKSAKVEHAAHVEKTAEKEAALLSSSSLKVRFGQAKRYMPFQGGSGRKLVTLQSGCKAKNETEQAHGFAEHFTQAFGGELQSIEAIYAEARKSFMDVVGEFQEVTRDTDMVPAELELKRAYSSLNPAKALGEGCTGPELFRHAAEELASLYHPLEVKAVLWIAAPFGWKVGQTMPLAKIPSPVKLTDSRDIRLEDPSAKTHGAIMRKPLLALTDRATFQS